MASSSALKRPRISVIVPALAEFSSVAAALRAFQNQTARHELEIVVLARREMNLDEADLVLVVGDSAPHEARALGVVRASGDHVVLAEDHCLPDPDWAQALLERLEEGWDGVGPSMRSGNPSSLWAQAAFVLGYGEWIPPLKSPRLPGHNAVVRRQLLLDRGDSLADELLIGSLLMRDLQRGGARFCMEPRAAMAHYDCTVVPWAVLSFLAIGSGFGAQRSNRWSLLMRLGFALAAPLVACLHWRRAFVHWRRSQPLFSPWAMVPAAVLASAWALGESIGCCLGARRVGRWVELGEINRLAHVSPSERP